MTILCLVPYVHKLKHFPAGKPLALESPRRPWSYAAIKFMTDLRTSEGNTTIKIITDQFSRFSNLRHLPAFPNALETAELLFEQIFRNYGLPEDILSDQGPQFISRV